MQGVYEPNQTNFHEISIDFQNIFLQNSKSQDHIPLLPDGLYLILADNYRQRR